MALSQSDDINVKLAETAALIQSGDVNSATILSGEILAHADNEIRLRYNSGQPIDEAASAFIEASLLHIHCLRLTGLSGDAFSCAVGALLTIEILSSKSRLPINAIRKLRLYDYALRSAIDCFESIGEPTGTEDENHRGYILSYLASLLFFYYNAAREETPEEPLLHEVYKFLQSILPTGAIQSPKINLGDAEVEPSSPAPLLIDILSRAASLGIYSC